MASNVDLWNSLSGYASLFNRICIKIQNPAYGSNSLYLPPEIRFANAYDEMIFRPKEAYSYKVCKGDGFDIMLYADKIKFRGCGGSKILPYGKSPDASGIFYNGMSENSESFSVKYSGWVFRNIITDLFAVSARITVTDDKVDVSLPDGGGFYLIVDSADTNGAVFRCLLEGLYNLYYAS